MRLAGERRTRPIPGFDLGNSPSEFSREAVEGKTVLFTTTNGTAALLGVQGARDIVVASYVNFSAVLALLRSALRGGADVGAGVCGRNRRVLPRGHGVCRALHPFHHQPPAGRIVERRGAGGEYRRAALW